MKKFDEPTDDPRGSGSYGDGVRFSISIHQYDETGFDSAGLRDYLKRAEELGFEGGWVLEQVIGEARLLAPLELLAWAAGWTDRLRLRGALPGLSRAHALPHH